MASDQDQTVTFGVDEGDNWFLRNRDALGNAAHRTPVIPMALKWDERSQAQSVCELGCSNGWQLAELASALPGRRFAGCDVSQCAISDGQARWPQLELCVGSLDRPNIEGPFDLVIVSFVFHWVARERLAASIASVDSLVRDEGALIIADFMPDRPCARPYHHRTDIEIYTFKQDYPRCFTGLGFYEEVEGEIFAHSGSGDGQIDPKDRACCVLLRKDLSTYEAS